MTTNDDGIRMSIWKITPQVADGLLARNKKNRQVRHSHVTSLAGAMSRGEWITNGEAIKIGIDGALQDGQHRLMAVIESGVTIKCVVIEGLPPIAQETMDNGVKRTMGNVLELRDVPSARSTAAALKAFFDLHGGRLSHAAPLTPSRQQLLAVLEEHPRITDSLPWGERLWSRLRYPKGIATALHYVFTQVDPEAADEFYERLAEGTGLEAGNPIHALRRSLENDMASRHGRMAARYRTAITIKAWNAWRQHQELRLVKWLTNEPFPNWNDQD